MAIVSSSTDYPEGTVLSVADHNDNVHSVTDGKGIMSVANGKVSTVNLADDFAIKGEHVMQEQAALARMEGMRRTNTVFADAVPTPNNEAFDLTDTDKWFTVPGCYLRWYQPYDASAALIHWSFFASANRWNGWAVDRDDVFWRLSAETAFVCSLDGTIIPDTRRYIPPSHTHPVSPGSSNEPGINRVLEGLAEPDLPEYGDGNPRYVESESHTSLHWDMSYLATSLSKGFHEIAVHCRIETMRCQEILMQAAGRGGEEWRMQGYFTPTNRMSFGIRNARVLTLL